jgi:hypothetical protein
MDRVREHGRQLGVCAFDAAAPTAGPTRHVFTGPATSAARGCASTSVFARPFLNAHVTQDLVRGKTGRYVTAANEPGASPVALPAW